jgi:hypothetical protein
VTSLLGVTLLFGWWLGVVLLVVVVLLLLAAAPGVVFLWETT